MKREIFRRLQAEEAFHDLWADNTDPEQIDVRRFFESPTALENRYARSMMGDVKGKRVLDIGPGLGESSICFALDGASVTAVDVSAHMLAVLNTLAQKHGVAVATIHSIVEQAKLEPGSFDFAFVANALHHVGNRERFIECIYGLLKPGGTAVFIDPLRYNPLINIYRWLAWKVRTVDEEPLGVRDFALFSQFQTVQHREFWLLSLLLFVKYFLVDWLHPNQERYWKRIYSETEATLWWWKPLAAIDRRLTRLPIIRWLSWNTVVLATK